MAKELKMGERTVKAHFARLYLMFDIDNRWVKKVRLIYLLHAHKRRKLWDEEDRQA